MAYLAQYGTVNEQVLFDYDTCKSVINTLSGMQLFAVIEQQNSLSGLTVYGYDKSFFGKKLKGTLTLEYLSDSPPNIENFSYDDGQTLPPYADILIGMEFWSEYAGMQSQEISHTYPLGSPRRQIFSYGVLLYSLQLQWRAYTDLIFESMSAGMMTGHRLTAARQQRDMINKVIALLDIFSKYQPQSKLQKKEDA